MAEYRGVLVVGEVEDKMISGATRELLGAGRRLAEALGDKLSAVIVGSGVGDAGRQAVAFGADRVYIVDDPLLGSYHGDAYAAVIGRICQQVTPSVLLFGLTDAGRDLAPRLAARMGGGLATNCIGLEIDPATRSLLQTCQVYGGNANSVVVSKPGRPQVVTVRPKSMPAPEPNDLRQGEIVTEKAGIDASVMRYKVVQKVKEEAAGVKLEDAKIVVAGGRGMGSKENFKVIWDLANVLGGAVGATRTPCEEGWVPSSLQIGQSGKVIAPELYIAVAISGAAQHIVSCLGSKTIVAINKDAEANMFKVANYGVVGDYKEALPALIQKCKELLGK